jgi:hypothetical protein
MFLAVGFPVAGCSLAFEAKGAENDRNRNSSNMLFPYAGQPLDFDMHKSSCFVRHPFYRISIPAMPNTF